MRKILIIFNIILISFAAAAQPKNNAAQTKSDSIIAAFNNALKNAKEIKTDFVKNPNNFYLEDPENPKDTIYLENYENFKFCTTKKSGDYVVINYFKGKVTQIVEKEQYTYYFNVKDGQHLLLTTFSYFRHGEQLDDYGFSLYQEERRMLFSQDGKPTTYIVRETEGSSNEININRLPFKQIDTKNIFYDKSEFENLGFDLLNNKIF